MNEIIKVNESPSKCKDIILKHVGTSSELKKITVFFDNANFIFTKYKVDYDVLFVAEKINGTEIHATQLNCGYGGNGPSSTYKVLLGLDVNESLAEMAFTSRGFEIDFTDRLNIVKDMVFFQYRNDAVTTSETFKFDEYSQVNIKKRRIKMFNPQVNNINGLFNAIDRMKPYTFEFFIGDDSPLDNGYRFKWHDKAFSHDPFGHQKLLGIKHVNIIIRGKIFDIYCLVDTNMITSVVNVIHSYLFKKPYFDEAHTDDSIYLLKSSKLTKIKMFLSLFKSKKNIHETLSLQ